MAVDIGPKIGIDGESEFRKQLSTINQSLKTLGSEMKVVTSEFANNAKSEEALTKKNEVLERTVLTLNDKLEMQSKALKESADKYGEADQRTMKWQQAVNETTAELNKAENEIKQNASAIDNLGNEVEDTGGEFKNAGKEAASFGDVLKANILGDMIIKGVEALANGIKKVAKAAKDAIVDAAAFADEMATLSVQTGLSTDTLQEFKYMEGLIDTDLTTLTGALSKLTKNMNSARDGTGATAEAFAQLGVDVTDANGELRNNEEVFYNLLDALGNVENETERDALAMQIFGKSAQELNPLIEAGSETLAEYAKEAHDMGYVLDNDTLESLNGVQDAMDRFHAVTDGVKRQLASALAPALEDVAAKFQTWAQTVDWEAVGQKLTEIVGKVGEFINFFVENGDYIISVIAAIAAGFLAWNVVSIITGLIGTIQGLMAAEEGLSAVQAVLNAVMAANPIGLIITAIAALTAGIIVLWNTNEDFRNFVQNAWESIKSFIVGAWEAIKSALANVGEWFTEKFTAAKTGIENAFSAIGQFFANVWQTIKNAFNGAAEWFGDLGGAIVRGIWQGISAMASWFSTQVKSFFSNIVSGVKRVLGIKSPSKVFAGIGKNMALGMGVGWDKEIGNIQRDIDDSIAGLIPSASGSVSVNSSVGGVSGGSADLAAAIKSALNGCAVVMDGKKVGTLITMMQNNATRARGAAVLL